ncbi:Microtubule-nucleating Tub4p (gamma-tubulin) complex component [Microsporum audouinii]
MPPHPKSANPRSRRVEDALSQLVDSLLPPSPHILDDDTGSESYRDGHARAEAAERDELRHQLALENAWRIIRNYGSGNKHQPGSSVEVSADVINNAPDLIKRRLLKTNATPDKAVRFSNLYSRLLTQPVLSQKWAILYLLYRIGGRNNDADQRDGNLLREGARSPLLDERQLDYMSMKEKLGGRRPNAPESINPGSSASAIGRNTPPMELNQSQREWRDSDFSKQPERKRKIEDETKPSGSTVRNMEDFIPAEKPNQEPEPPAQEKLIVKPSEPEILRDLPFFLQGLSTTNLEFLAQSVLKLPKTLPTPIVSLLHTLAEPCLLYRGLSKFVEQSEGGLIEQSLRAAVGSELRSYLGLVASLEGEIRRALTAVSQDSANQKTVMGAGVTLKRCVIWTKDATLALRLMSLMVEEAQNKRGGQLISMIHEFSTSHGDPFVGAYAERLLTQVTRPFYNMLRQWIYDGELSDPYNEFFVVEPETRPDIDPRRAATSVWDEKYKLDNDMVPTIMTHDFAKKVFLIGKSLNFIRYGCGDSAWVVAYSRESSKALQYGDTATLETYIDEAYKTTMARLIFLMDSKFKLFDHLKALKKYLLLGQGDFIALLMESLASNLDRPANSQYRHTLTAQLEHAIRSSNAQHDSPEVLRRLDARMLELSHGEIGWDCFTLEYKIDAPVDVIITPWASTQYLKVFNFLWRVKRVEFALGSTWRRCMTGARGVLGGVDDKLGADWKKARCVIAEMIHFVCQLQYYILFEVIEASWDQLQIAISKPGCTLDDLIEAHTKYLNSITHKGLLGSSSSSFSRSTGNKEDSFLSQLHQILKVMLAYKDAVDGLYSFSVAEFTRRQELNAKIELRTAQGRWGVTEKDVQEPSTRPSRSGSTRRVDPPALGGFDVPPNQKRWWTADPNTPGTPIPSGDALFGGEDHLLPSLRERLLELSSDFRVRLVTLLGDLAYQPDVDMRFLGVVMNFNDVYQVARRRRGVSTRDKRKCTGGPGGESTADRDQEKAAGIS